MKKTELSSTFGERVVTLSDGRAGLRGGMRVETTVPTLSTRAGEAAPAPAIIDFVASDETLDRYDEILCSAGWRLESYRRNPVFQLQNGSWEACQWEEVIGVMGDAVADCLCGTSLGE